MSQLRIMLFNNHLEKPIVQPSAFIRSYLVNFDNMVPNGKQTLPTSNGIGTNNRMHSAERRPDIVRRSTGLRVQLKSLFRGSYWQSSLCKGGS